ncbi:MAG: hypothetical protein ACPGWR_00070 [Ardenticatenaceae bacterium]
MAIEYIKEENLASHQQECDCGFVIEVSPGLYICTKQQEQAQEQAQAEEPTIDYDEIIWF